MIHVDEEENDGRTFSSETLENREPQVSFKPKLKRHTSYSPGIRRKNKHTSLNDPDSHESLLLSNGSDNLRQAKSAHDLRICNSDVIHNGKIRAASSLYDMDYTERDEVLSQVSLNFRSKLSVILLYALLK